MAQSSSELLQQKRRQEMDDLRKSRQTAFAAGLRRQRIEVADPDPRGFRDEDEARDAFFRHAAGQLPDILARAAIADRARGPLKDDDE